MDATLAVSEGGANTLMQRLISLASTSSSSSTTAGPFTVGYSVSVALSGGSVQLLNAPVNRLRVNNVNVSGSVGAFFSFDLNNILPRICIPPFRVCIRIPFIGRVCTPQFCPTWPSLNVAVALPFSVNLSAEFGISVRSIGPNWEVDLLVFPFTLSVDLTPSAALIIAAIRADVNAALSGIPLIGPLIAGLINTVIGALTPLLSGVLAIINAFINTVLGLLNLFSLTVPVPLLTFPKQQTFLPAGVPLPADPPVDMTIAALNAGVLDRELVATADFA